MDRKIEDKIAKLAFGELSEAEAANVRAQAAANTDSAKALDSYEALRNDLRRLKDVPPDQLSKERLQTAILKQGLSPKPVRRSAPWLWASPIALAAVLAAAFYVRPAQDTQPITEPAGVQQPDLTAMLNQDDMVLANSQVQFDGSESVSTDEAAPAPQVVKAPEAKPSHAALVDHLVRPSSRRRHTSQVLSDGALAIMIPEQATPQARDQQAETQPDASNAQAPKNPADTIVLIQGQADGDTGAKKAVEVHQTQDVIVSS